MRLRQTIEALLVAADELRDPAGTTLQALVPMPPGSDVDDAYALLSGLMFAVDIISGELVGGAEYRDDGTLCASLKRPEWDVTRH